MSRKILVSLFSVLCVAAFASFAAAQDVDMPAADAAVNSMAAMSCNCNQAAACRCALPCRLACRPAFVKPCVCCAPILPPRVIVDPSTSTVYRRGLLGCYRPVCPPVAVCEPCCPPAPRFYRACRPVGCCW